MCNLKGEKVYKADSFTIRVKQDLGSWVTAVVIMCQGVWVCGCVDVKLDVWWVVSRLGWLGCVCMYERVGDSSCMRRRRAGLVASSCSGFDEGCKLRLRCPFPPGLITLFTTYTTFMTPASALLSLVPSDPFLDSLA